MKVEVTVCNECERVGVATEEYVISKGGREVKLDLCSDHAQPIEALMQGRPTRPRKKAAKRATTARRPARTPILTPEQIEERKKEQAAARS